MMITAASIIFLLAFVALGARPYRVALPLPPCEEVAAMPATVYAGDNAYSTGTDGSRDECKSDSYFALALRREAQQHRDQCAGMERRIARLRQKLAEIRKARSSTPLSRCLDILEEDLKCKLEEIARAASAQTPRQSYIAGQGSWSSSGNNPSLAYTEPPKALPPCSVCHNTLSKPYPDRDYYCDHCKSFVSLNAAR